MVSTRSVPASGSMVVAPAPGIERPFLSCSRMRSPSVPFSGAPLKPTSMWARLREATDGDDPGPGDAPLQAALEAPRVREANLVAIADLPASPALATLTRRVPGTSLTWLLELLADPRELDPRTWLMLHTEARQTARIWDEAERPVAVSHQTTAIFD